MQGKYDKLLSEHNALNSKFQQLQEDNQRDIESRIQVIIIIIIFLIVYPVILFFVKHYNVISVGDVTFSSKFQEAIKKYESLPAELESLKAVLEMKNEEIRQLRKEKMEKHLEVCT